MCSLAHNLLKLLIKRNRRCADALQSVDAVQRPLEQLHPHPHPNPNPSPSPKPDQVELLLEQLPSGWNPPVIEVFPDPNPNPHPNPNPKP
jgi:hypothetical protein